MTRKGNITLDSCVDEHILNLLNNATIQAAFSDEARDDAFKLVVSILDSSQSFPNLLEHSFVV